MAENKQIKKFVSSGGLGDFFIICLKLHDLITETKLFDDNFTVDWVHIESNDIEKQCAQIFSLFNFQNVEFKFKYDPNYIQNINSYLDGRYSIPTPVVGKCSFYQKEFPLYLPYFPDIKNQEIKYDICVQVSAGMNNNRSWKFNPLCLKDVFKDKKICFIGTNENFKSSDELNFVGKQTLIESLNTINQSNLYVGLSGLFSYWACANLIPNIHLIESAHHEISYYHPEWKKITKGIEIPALSSVVSCVKLMETQGVFL